MNFKIVSMKTLFFALLGVGLLLAFAPKTEAAGVTVYKDGEKYVKIGGRIMVQYHREDPDTGSPDDEATDSLFFRRLRPYIEGSIHEDWKGKIQFDLGKASSNNEIAIKEAYMEYTGFKGLKIKLGNYTAPFSREKLTSSKKQHLVERTFVGDHNYGTPDKNLGIHVTGSASDAQIGYALTLASSSIDPDDDKLDFDTPVNASSDFNQGILAAARIDYHPFGRLKFSQGDFKRNKTFLATVSLAAFVWNNDDDNNTYTDSTGADTSGGAKPDVDTVTGLEISTALRYHGASIDAEYNLFNVETIDAAVTSGIYEDGETTLTNFAIEGGYMVLPDQLEIALGYEVQDADHFVTEWTRTSVGVNYFVKKHDIKLQATYRIGDGIKGKKANDLDEIFVQAQYVF